MMFVLKTINLLTFTLLFAINNIWTAGIENLPWQGFGSDIGCKSEIQPLVEYYNLNGTQYLLFSQKVTWEEASMLCGNYNAKLAILDSMIKATSIAVTMADSNMVMEDTWLGGRRSDNQIWTWMVSEISNQMNSLIPLEPNTEEYPPWSRIPTRPAKECLAIDRRGHSDPIFIDLDCRLLRPFICEKKSEDSFKKPIPSKRILIHKSTYTLYHGKVTWREAAAFCRSFAARLAIIKNPNIIETLSHAMIKARPAFENLWIGAHFSYGQWVWMATGTILNAITDAETGYPPWPARQSKRSDGCLLFDRHHDNMPQFVETSCDRKRDFVCEEYSEDEMEDWLNEPMKFTYNKEVFIIYPVDKTWDESHAFCEERGSILAYLNDINATNMIIEAMGDHPKGISHIWIGARLSRSNEWKWSASGAIIPKEINTNGFPPWTNTNERYDFLTSNLSCLNLDRSDHVRPFIYGLDCDMKQPFICKITCDQPPHVENGNWTCDENETKKTCQINCQGNYITMGLSKISCSHQFGWETESNSFEVPHCLAPRDYAVRFTRSLEEDIKHSPGYFVIFDHSDSNVRPLLLKFVTRLLKIFPIGENLRFGMFSGITDSPEHLNFTQTDFCSVLRTIQSLGEKIAPNNSIRDVDFLDLEQDLYTFQGQRAIIFGFIDGTHEEQYEKIFSKLKMSGHQIFIIGMKNDEDLLIPLASSNTNRRKTVHLFDGKKDLNMIITEMQKLQRSDHRNCSSSEDSYQNQSTTTRKPTIKYSKTTLSPINPIDTAARISSSGEDSTVIKESSISNATDVDHSIDEDTNPRLGPKRNEPTVTEPSVFTPTKHSTDIVEPNSDIAHGPSKPKLEDGQVP